MVSDAFVVVVVGGMGSIPGAFLAALLIAEIKAFCIGLGYSELTLVAEFIVKAVVLIARPWGLLGRSIAELRGRDQADFRLAATKPMLAMLAVLALVPIVTSGYALVLLTDVLVFVISP